jgi:hypothetical protein
VLKLVLVVALFIALDVSAGRVWAYGALALPLLGAAWVHLYWLPRRGINGWTAEPYDKYLELVGGASKRSR